MEVPYNAVFISKTVTSKKKVILFKILWDKLGINPIWRNNFFNLQGIPLKIYK